MNSGTSPRWSRLHSVLLWELPPVVPRTLLALVRIAGIALAAVLYLSLRIWIDAVENAELVSKAQSSLEVRHFLFPRALQFQAFYALAALIKARYVLLCAILVGLLLFLFSPKRGWLYGLIVGGLTALAWLFGYRVYWNHLPLWLGAWDAAAETLAVVAPAVVAYCTNWVVTTWWRSRRGSPSQHPLPS